MKSLPLYASVALLFFRLFNSVATKQLFVRGYFTADEYWQSLEVAHNLVWGYGYLTWEWKVSAIRSVCYPAIFAAVYKGLDVLGIDSPWVVAYTPRLLCGVLLWLSDLSLYDIGERLQGTAFARRVLALYIGSWFVFYCGVRTYGNALEMVLNVFALQCWLKNQFWRWNIAVAVGCLMRPTAVLTWLPCYFAFLGHWKRLAYIALLAYYLLSAAFLSFQALVDSLYYGRLTLTAYSFLKVNLLDGIAENYGTHPWYWYLVLGAEVPLFSYSPFVAVGAVVVWRRYPAVAKLILPMAGVCLIVLSASAHKEYRFLLPIMPLLVILTAYAFDAFPPRTSRALLYAAIAVQVPVAIYTSQWHQSAALATVDYLRSQGAKSVDFWTDCHLTPYYSHFHSKETRLSFLDCSPL